MNQHDKHTNQTLVLLCLLALFAQMAFSSRRLSLTYDEPIYAALGYADLTTGDVRWHGVIGHPPLINVLTAWPLLLESPRPDAQQIQAWGTADSLGFSRDLLAEFASLERVTFVTRIPIMWLTLILAAFVYRWARQTWGRGSGTLALALCTFDPTILAHGQLNTTDMGLAAFGFMACYALARYLNRPTWKTYLGVGLGLGAALASKASGPFWWCACGIAVFAFWLTNSKIPAQKIHTMWIWGLRMVGWGLLALLVPWTAYLFELRPLTPGGIPIPAASHWSGLPYIRSYMATGQKVFVAGRLIESGHWSYFPLALLVKTPVSLMLGILLAVVWTSRNGFGPRWSSTPLFLVPLVYLTVAMLMALNIGHRHMLPLMPFLFVFISRIAQEKVEITPRISRRVFYVLPLLLALISLRIFPHYLTYFNVLAGGPNNGYHYLADSSVDWGQGMKALAEYLDQRDVDSVQLAAFSSLDPALYNVRYQPLPPTVNAPITMASRFDPEPGIYAISAVPFQGVWLLDPDTYDWFRHREPVAHVGHALLIYDITDKFPARWVAQCAKPFPPLSATEIAAGFGRNDLHVATFDCSQSWLYPAGDAGWTILPDNAAPDSWTTARVEGTTLSFQQGAQWDHPALSIYAQSSLPTGSIPPHTTAQIAPMDGIRAGRTEDIMATAPIRIEGPLSFLGYGVQMHATTIELHTYWRVEDIPAPRLLSLMAHLLAADGTVVAAGDGLGVPIEAWRPGDVIVQRHHLDVPPEDLTDLCCFQTGVYWLDTMERWPILVDGQTVGDRLLLQPHF